jgi:hypothetical protein
MPTVFWLILLGVAVIVSTVVACSICLIMWLWERLW